jgi:hypothetical protein
LNFASGNLVLRADNTGTGQGTVFFDHGAHVDYTGSTGTVSLFYNPSGSPTTKYQNPTNYFCPPCPGGGGIFVNQPSQLTAYMLVNNATDLQNVSTNVGGTYALGRNIDAGSIANFTPIQNFTGLFDGQSQTIANLTIVSTAQKVGLFGSIDSTGVVRNLNLADATVSGPRFVGTLAGTNAGTISNVSATDIAVSVGANGNGGGLVGLNSGTITNAFASGDVTGAAGTNGFTTLGGLAAANTGSILNSFASVDVGSPDVVNLQAGGLVGNNAGTIRSSFATGQVEGGTGSTVGGLAALNLGTIAGATAPALTQPCVAGQTCATGAVNVGSNGIGGGLVGSNSGTITNAFATGDITGAAGTNGFTTLGGLAAVNLSLISNSFASGDAGSPNVANLQTGGLVGSNSGTILSSIALGNVQTGDASIAGGLVASNSVTGSITGAHASGNVTVAAASVAGGLVGTSAGAITDSTASGAVSSTGANSTVGALVGTSTGTIINSIGLGVVTGGVPPAPNLPPIPPIIPGCSDPLCGLPNILPPGTATLPAGLLNILPPATATLPGAAFFASLPGPTQVINNLVGIGPSQLAALNPAAPPSFETLQGGIRLPPQQAALPAQGGSATRGSATATAGLRPEGHRHSAVHSDPVRQGRGGAANRRQCHGGKTASRGRAPWVDAARLGKLCHHRLDRGALPYHHR